MIGIYKITSPKNKIYIGQTIDIKRRLNLYKKGKCEYQIRLLRSILKYGWDNHVFEVLEECAVENLNERERFWQENYDVLGKNGLNCRLTKSNDKTGYLSIETRTKMSISQLGRKHTQATKDKIKKNQKKHTQDHINKIILFNRTKLLNISGQKFNMLLALDRHIIIRHSTKWEFKCDCGNIKFINVQSVKSGCTKSCGCRRKNRMIEMNKSTNKK